jgi:L-fucose isomerase-like protein
MKHKTPPASRTPIRGKGWKRPATIATDKYDVISSAILGSLTASPIAFYELVKRVGAKVDSFDGSVPWYTMSCLRELEVQGKVLKHTKPVRYSRAPAPKAG